MPEQWILNDKIMAWVNGWFPVDRLSDKLINDNPNKYSAYYHFGTNSLLQNKIILKTISFLFASDDTGMAH